VTTASEKLKESFLPNPETGRPRESGKTSAMAFAM
jgi:hypothetical protein